MSDRIERAFRKLKASKKKALSLFLTAGFPRLSAMEKLVPELAAAGVDFFEIGFPFSDPIADGPVIQRSSEEALKNGMKWERLLASVRRIRKKTQAPLILMTYGNVLYSRGWEKSIRDMARAGFDGAILPDMIPEEAGELQSAFKREGLSLVYLLAPTSSAERIGRVGRSSSGFIYCVSVTGVTGARSSLPLSETRAFLRRIKSKTRLPVLLGFGISQPRQIRSFKGSADGFIIGSAFIKFLDENRRSPSLIQKAKNFIMPFKRQCQ